MFATLLPRVQALIEPAAAANLNLTIDAEESDRLELSLDLFDALAQGIAKQHPQWAGFGLAVQAYQTRALPVVDEVAAIARRHGLRFMVRLVKGAYWDGEIKRAQEQGLPGYPVFTHKHHTDLSYLACAQRADRHHEVIYPQFATHNAGTIAAIVQMARSRWRGLRDAAPARHGRRRVPRGAEGPHAIACRVYAPVGEHRDLLAYLVRRLLENGANSSFVHQLADPKASAPRRCWQSPLRIESATVAAAAGGAVRRVGHGRANSTGVQTWPARQQREPVAGRAAGAAAATCGDEATPERGAAAAMAPASAGFGRLVGPPVAERAALLRRAGDALDARLAEFCGLLVREAGKTWGDAVAEVREAVDFCRYYADQAELRLADQLLPGPTAKAICLRLHGRGVFVCISPWNFPLAIFAGQVVAALVAGNSGGRQAGRADAPRRTALRGELLHAAGVPADALQLLHGLGETVGAQLVADVRRRRACASPAAPQVARLINRTLAPRTAPSCR